MRAVARRRRGQLAPLPVSDNPAALAALENVSALMHRTQRKALEMNDVAFPVRGVFCTHCTQVKGLGRGDLVFFAEGDTHGEGLHALRVGDNYEFRWLQRPLGVTCTWIVPDEPGDKPIPMQSLEDVEVLGRVLGWMHIHR